MTRRATLRQDRILQETTGKRLPAPSGFPRGGCVGQVQLVDCVQEHDSPWFCGPWGWVVEDAEEMRLVPWRGEQGLFTVRW